MMSQRVWRRAFGAGAVRSRRRRVVLPLVGPLLVGALVGIGSTPVLASGSGTIATVAGTGSSGDAVPAATTALDFPTGIAVDASHNLLISDSGDNKVRILPSGSGTFYGQPVTAGITAVVAGQGLNGFGGDGGPGPVATMNYVETVVVDGHGNLVLTDNGNYRIRLLAGTTGTFYGQAMTTGDIYTVAGDGTSGFAGDGGPATAAEVNAAGGVAVDGSGNLVITDGRNERVRVVAETTGTFYGQVMTAGDIYTVAGDGTAGYAGDGGPAISAQLNTPTGVTLDPSNNILIGDQSNNRVRVVATSTGTHYGRAMTAGDIYTVAGNGLAGYSGDGAGARLAKLNTPAGVTVDPNGNVLVADSGNGALRVVAEKTGTFYGISMTRGDIYTVAGTGTEGFGGDQGPSTSAELGYPASVAVDANHNLVLDDTSNHRVRVIATTTGVFYGAPMTAGDIYTIVGDGTNGYAGDGGPATSAELLSPFAVAATATGSQVIADSLNNRVRVVAATTGTFFKIAMTAGSTYTIAGNGTAGFIGDGGPATSAELSDPAGLAVDAHGNVVLSDYGNARIRVVAAKTGTFYGLAMTAGDIYTLAGDGTVGYSGDAGPATSAELGGVQQGLVVDTHGNIVLADIGNNRIRVVALASKTFYGQPMTAGDIYSIAGDGTGGFNGDRRPATATELDAPVGLTADSAGNLVFTDVLNNRLRVFAAATGTFYGQAMRARHIYTIAGTGTLGFNGDGIPATTAEVNFLHGAAVDAHGNVIFADDHNNRVRVVAGATGTFYGVPMSTGDIYTIAGNGTLGYSGDNGPAVSAELFVPVDVAVLTGSGNVLVVDYGNSRIREIAS